jgi:arylformamidase
LFSAVKENLPFCTHHTFRKTTLFSMIIYKQYNQEELDNQYNNRLHVPDFATYLERWDTLSEATRQKHAYVKDLQYGDHPRECLDIFPSGKPGSKVLVFIHGGYWHLFDKTTFHFIAAAFLPHHITTAVINYPLHPAASMDEIVASCRKGVRWLQQNLAAFNPNPQEVYIAGHSAGAHLAAMLMSKNPGVEIGTFIKGMCLLSGLYNLVPVQLSYLNAVLGMDKETALSNSPVNLPAVQTCLLLVAAGGTETDEFKDQSRELYNCWKTKMPVQLVELGGLNHYSILDALVDENTSLHKAIIKLMDQ